MIKCPLHQCDTVICGCEAEENTPVSAQEPEEWRVVEQDNNCLLTFGDKTIDFPLSAYEPLEETAEAFNAALSSLREKLEAAKQDASRMRERAGELAAFNVDHAQELHRLREKIKALEEKEAVAETNKAMLDNVISIAGTRLKRIDELRAELQEAEKKANDFEWRWFNDPGFHRYVEQRIHLYVARLREHERDPLELKEPNSDHVNLNQ